MLLSIFNFFFRSFYFFTEIRLLSIGINSVWCFFSSNSSTQKLRSRAIFSSSIWWNYYGRCPYINVAYVAVTRDFVSKNVNGTFFILKFLPYKARSRRPLGLVMDLMWIFPPHSLTLYQWWMTQLSQVKDQRDVPSVPWGNILYLYCT